MREETLIRTDRPTEAKQILNQALNELYHLEDILNYKGVVSKCINKLQNIKFEVE